MNSKKEILYIGGFELPDKNAAAQRVFANGKLLTKLGYNVSFLGLDREIISSGNIFDSVQNVEDFKYWSLKYPQSVSEWMNYLSSISSIKKVIENYLSLKPVMIIAYNYPAVALFNLRSYCLKHNIKLVADCTEWYQPTGSVVFRLIKSLDTFFRMRWVHNNIDGVIAISKYLYEYYNKRTKNVVLLPPLIDKNNPKWSNTNYKPNQICELIYAGSPGDGNKDKLDLILKALAEVKKRETRDFRLTIIGLSEEQYISSFGIESIPNNIKNDILFKGRLSHLDTINAIKTADYSIFIREKRLVTLAGFPTKFVEAISCGTPVLTNGSSNIEDYLIEGENGYLLDLYDFKTLTKTLEHAISQSPEKILSMKNFCKNSNLFDFNNFTNDFSIFFNKVH